MYRRRLVIARIPELLCSFLERSLMELKCADSQVYSLEELQLVAELAKKYNVLVISDEVYEYLIYPPNKHYRIGLFVFRILCMTLSL